MAPGSMVGAALLVGAAAAGAPSKQPHIAFMLVDDLGFNDVRTIPRARDSIETGRGDLPDSQFLYALDLGGMGDTLAREGRDQNALDCLHRSSRGPLVVRAACCCGRVV